MTTVNSPIYTDRSSIQTKEREIKKELGKDDFLKILVTQLQYQDPMQPLEDREFIAQMAQFSALEQMTKIADLQATNNSMQQFQAFQLVGKNIEGISNNSVVKGVVTEVRMKDGLAVLKVNGVDISMKDILSVFNTTQQEQQINQPTQPTQPSEPTPTDNDGTTPEEDTDYPQEEEISDSTEQ
ncbi:hypothetical protein BHU72_03320 [Desulfuribacillus stibiiarsenatis]|uniref:Flagellar hook capping protein n=1 Tax=Desulfuribacillus stibiiarsenatis TaxID=1390249 RepID=A0A1E5L733_9FIRM|nr:flagellar hook capping FlgD N-terminal domain-containing protein [Desulfuribacillus stibiiarsenatis]OEH85824.1 hypothetical protein BHU72_03320 [Desulfuribacillus stibiiarsenatis]